MWTALIGPIANIAGSWMDGKVEQTKAKAATNVAKAKAEAVIMEKKATGEIDWDLEMAKGSHSSFHEDAEERAISISQSISPVAFFSMIAASATAFATLVLAFAFVCSTFPSIQLPAIFAIGPINAVHISFLLLA